MTAVLLLGEVPSTGYVGGVAAERVILGPNPPAVPASRFIALAADRLTNQGAIIALYPAWHDGAADRFIRLARGVLNTDRIAGLGLSLPPLALSLVADQLTYLAPYVPAGLLASLATRLPEEIIAGAWLRSVTNLEHIGTQLSDHLRSYMPGAFMVSAAPRPGVHRISGGHPVGPIEHRPQTPIQVLATQAEGDTDWFQQKLMGEIRPSVVKFVNAQPLSPTYWGVKKYVEYVAFSGHPEALSRLVNSTRTRSCPWCGEPISVRTCPFCRATRELLTAAPAQTETAYGTPLVHPTEPEHTPPAPPEVDLTPRPSPGTGPAATGTPSGPNQVQRPGGRPARGGGGPSGPQPVQPRPAQGRQQPPPGASQGTSGPQRPGPPSQNPPRPSPSPSGPQNTPNGRPPQGGAAGQRGPGQEPSARPRPSDPSQARGAPPASGNPQGADPAARPPQSGRPPRNAQQSGRPPERSAPPGHQPPPNPGTGTPGDRRAAAPDAADGPSDAAGRQGAAPPGTETARRPTASTPPANPRQATSTPGPADVSDPRNGVL